MSFVREVILKLPITNRVKFFIQILVKGKSSYVVKEIRL